MATGQFTLLSLPIGNLGDLTPRVHKVLQEDTGALFVCEDTRQFKTLMNHLGLDSHKKEVISFHDHDRSSGNKVIHDLRQGRDVYMVSDAGSPVISDPAYPLIQEVLEAGIEPETYPGVNAIIPALELSGLPPHPFSFHGFLPREEKKKKAVFEKALEEGRTHIFFESPHRLEKGLELLASLQQAEEIHVAVARELTKKFQTVYRFRASEYPQKAEEMMFKGECVLLLAKEESETDEQGQALDPEKLQKLAQNCLDRGGHPKAVSKLLAEIFQENSKDMYARLSQKSKKT